MTTNMKQKPTNTLTVALVGRVNVGKSTLFNALIESQKAIDSNTPGTTRTSNEGDCIWRGKDVHIIDTGGLTFEDEVLFEKEILAQSKKAMKQADIILFITDAKTGVLPQEKTLAKHLRRITEKPVILVANKVDNKRIAATLTTPDWYKLGLGEPFPISAVNGRNTGDLLDHIFDLAKERNIPTKDTAQEPIKNNITISLIGKPNVGKSSLFNQIIKENKVIVSDVAHTTREPYDTDVTYTHKVGDEEIVQPITFIDTAGIRRKSRVKGKLEREGIGKSINTVDDSDIILFTIDGSEPISSQDMQLGGLIEKRSKSVILLINKWDLAEDTSDTNRQQVKRMVYSYFPHLKFAEIVFVSGKSGYGVHNIFPIIMQAWDARHTVIPQAALNNFLKQVTQKHRPSRGKGTRHPRLLGLKQINSAPPIFEVIVKYRTSLHRSYMNYMENKLREQFNFFATPIVIKLTKSKK